MGLHGCQGRAEGRARVMPKVAIVSTRRCVAEQSQGWQSKAKGGNRCKARGGSIQG